MGCCFKKPRDETDTSGGTSDEERGRGAQTQPLIDNNPSPGGSPNTQRKKKRGKQQAEYNPFNKPRKYSYIVQQSAVYKHL